MDVSDRLRASYDAVPYQGGAHYATHPTCLATLGTLLGMDPGPPARCRVLELGCATGGNLNPMAAQLPGSEFLGIDLSENQIRAARDMAEAAELPNVRFEAADLMDLGGEIGEFDYIICHGVYSWVPEAVRRKILAICGSHLSERGLAYISYNTQPGSQRRELARGVARFGAAHVLEDGESVDQILGLWKAVAEAMPDAEHTVARQLRAALDEIHGAEQSYIVHEYLEEVNEPLWFYEVADAAGAAGLQYVGEAMRAVDLSDFDEGTRERIHRLAPTLTASEQLLDLVAHVPFRRSVFCRSSVALDRRLESGRLLSHHLYASAMRHEAHPDGSVTFRTRSRKSVTTNNPVLIAALDLLQEAWPGGIRSDELLRMAEERSDPGARGGLTEARFVEAVATLWLKNAVVLMSHPLTAATDVPPRPRAHRLSRVQARRGGPITNLLHQTVELPAEARRLLPLLDGTHTLEALRPQWAPDDAAPAEWAGDGDPLVAYLERFAKLGLLVAPDGDD